MHTLRGKQGFYSLSTKHHSCLSIADGLLHLSLRNLGSPMIYDLVEVNTVVAVHYMYLLSHSLLFQYVRDCLTDNNRPCGRCPICQYDFQVTYILSTHTYLSVL